jgi:putative hydrolase of the HAD superfamily
MPTNGRLHLVIDADDTLWENNVYFERAFQHFAAYLAHSSLSDAAVRLCLDRIEDTNRIRYGYGSVQFGRNMVECFEELSERGVSEADREQVMHIALGIMEHPLELIPGVRETLEHLAARHRLTLFTKGDPAEQHRKVDSSGLAGFFEDVVVTREKEPASYRALLAQRGAHAEHSWMIGNSPKSDINPALAIGMNAVFIPHERNWHLEHEEIVPGAGAFLQLERFMDLRDHF